MTRFYVSARFGRQAEAREAAEEITRLTGWECTARWLHDTPENDQAIHEDRAAMLAAAEQDIDDIRAADIMFCLTEDLTPHRSHRFHDSAPVPRLVSAGLARGGRHVEVGIAIQRSIPILLIGPRENVFHGLASRHETVEDACCVALTLDLDAALVDGVMQPFPNRKTGEGQ